MDNISKVKLKQQLRLLHMRTDGSQTILLERLRRSQRVHTQPPASHYTRGVYELTELQNHLAMLLNMCNEGYVELEEELVAVLDRVGKGEILEVIFCRM